MRQKLDSEEALEKFRTKLLADKEKKPSIMISICHGTGCQAYGCGKVSEAFREAISRLNAQDKIEVKITGCHGFCERGTVVVVEPGEVFYQRVKPEDSTEIVSSLLDGGGVVERLLYTDAFTGERFVKRSDVPFYKKQLRLIFGDNGHIDPTCIEDYIAIGGYTALSKAIFHMSPEEIIEEVKRSGLRGRGGAGFPTGNKWEFCRRAKGSPKYVVVNADEGDPGAYMDRSLLEGNPHSVLEGLIIGAYAIGASEGYIYVRHEYPLAVHNVRIAIQQARELGILGTNILNSGFDFDVHIVRGVGAFVCGEETALIASIEGRRGMPRSRPPFPAISGLWGKPTNINNVETWANVPLIINKGADWYSAIGTKTSKGTKIFSLVGKVNNTGLVEVPMGITLAEIIFDIGGGIKDSKKFKAVQTGGPSGGCLPASLLDLPVDFESLAAAGSIMGSGGMIVADEDTCMVDLTKYFLNFTQAESCGKCPPCRVGTRQMLGILERIVKGEGRPGDIELLERVAMTVKQGSLCGLGQTAPNPVLTTLRYFRDEYEAHINEKRCPALVCKDLISFYILPDKCQGCMICMRSCPVEAISGGKRLVHVVDQNKCTKCGTCVDVCPPRFSAVVKVSGERVEVPAQPVPVQKPE